MTLLDNPIWFALTTHQQHLSSGDDTLARRFLPGVGPLSGMASQNSEAYSALALLAQPGEQLVLFLDTPLNAPEGWQVDIDDGLVQMVLEKSLPPVGQNDIAPLTEEDIPQMLALTKLTKPGPFRERTIDLGGYVGIKKGNRLLAMAGKRVHLPGFIEISAVCTHPDAQGRGYARRLMSVVAQDIIARGETPFLHTWEHNTHAIGVYEKMGFKLRRVLRAVMVRSPGLVLR